MKHALILFHRQTVCPGGKTDKAADKQGDGQQKNDHSVCGRGAEFEVTGQKQGPGVKQDVKQDGTVNLSAFADVSQQQAHEKSVGALQQIHVIDAENKRLHDIGCPERERFLGLAQCDAAENQLLRNRAEQSAVEGHGHGEGAGDAGVLKKLFVCFQPAWEYEGNECDNIGSDKLRAGHQHQDSQERNRVKGAGRADAVYAAVTAVVPDTKKSHGKEGIVHHQSGAKQRVSGEFLEKAYELLETRFKSKAVNTACEKRKTGAVASHEDLQEHGSDKGDKGK